MVYYAMTENKRKTREPKDYKIKGRMWIEGKEGTFLGYGRVVLLERIKQCGSISEAARSMNMSYRHAWKLVDSMNSQGRSKLVETAAGGRGGGGTILTGAGEKAVKLFWKFYEEFNAFVKEKEKKFKI